MNTTEKLAEELFKVARSEGQEWFMEKIAKHVQRMVLDAQIKELENIDFFETETLWIKERIEKISKRLEELRSERNRI